MRPALLLLPLLLVAAQTDAAESRIVPASQLQVQLSFAPVVRRAAPAVVNIFTRAEAKSGSAAALRTDPAFRRYLGEDEEPGENSLGSGVIVDPHGTIITNQHVIEAADTITVVLSDRREFAATVRRADDRTDLAVLEINPGSEALPYLEIRDSDELEVGDIVLAIGNPFGVGQTVTSGIVSALARNVDGINAYRTFIQTDAAINPGNSGGALVSLDGRLVGINTALYSEGGGSVGIGFAIPTALIRAVLANGPSGARIVRPWLGAVGHTVTAAAAKRLGLAKPIGMAIEEIGAASPAAEAGLRPGDVVLSVDGKPIEDVNALRFRFATLLIGTTARLTIWRSGETRQLEVKLTAPAETPPRNVTLLKPPGLLAGATVASLSPALAEELQADAVGGVIVLEVPRGTPASRFGLAVGDVVESADGQPVATVAGLQQHLTRKAVVELTLRRDGRVLHLPPE
jgi:Do/DeqQ family serine protease